MDAFTLADVRERHARAGRLYHEFLRVPAMSAGLYVLEAGVHDPQRPHDQDELYYVVAGRASFRAGGEARDVGPGDVLYVPAGAPHRFESVQERIELLVIFAPAEEPPGEGAATSR